MILFATTLIIATLFTAIAIYITLVEHPARMALSDVMALAHWQPSYARALPIQGGLAVIGGLMGLISWHQSGNWQWLAGSLILLSNWPFTLIAIMPTNKRLMNLGPENADGHSRQMLVRWGRLHIVRDILGSLAAALFFWGLVAAT